MFCQTGNSCLFVIVACAGGGDVELAATEIVIVLASAGRYSDMLGYEGDLGATIYRHVRL
jgi:hypothetical protein